MVAVNLNQIRLKKAYKTVVLKRDGEEKLTRILKI
jgi:hypothetical protein